MSVTRNICRFGGGALSHQGNVLRTGLNEVSCASRLVAAADGDMESG